VTRVAITGIGELPQGRSSAASPMALHATLADAALADAGLARADADCILTVSPRADPYLIHAAALAEHLGIAPAITWTLEAGGAAPQAMIEVGCGLIASGRARTVLVVAADMPLGSVTRASYIKALAEVGPVHPDYERPFGPTVPSMFGLVARAHMEAYGTTRDDLGAVALHDRSMAARHPNAHQRGPLTLEAYLAGAPIAEPLALFDCAPVSDGGGAFVLRALDDAASATHRPVIVAGTGFATGQLHLSAASDLTTFGAGRALDQALAAAKRPRNGIDLALVYDCFTIAMLVNVEDMGLADKGRAGAAFHAGEFALDGRLPLNTHGGLLSHGHPARAGGIANVIEGVAQLRGTAGERQVRKANVAIAHGMGGVFATHAVCVLEAA
jgi:acetyl-CoA acetyltransferase